MYVALTISLFLVFKAEKIKNKLKYCVDIVSRMLNELNFRLNKITSKESEPTFTTVYHKSN